jgi:hypothetical protein
MPPERKGHDDDFDDSGIKYLVRQLRKDSDEHDAMIKQLREDVFGKDGLSTSVVEIKSQIKTWIAVAGVLVGLLVPVLTNVLDWLVKVAQQK